MNKVNKKIVITGAILITLALAFSISLFLCLKSDDNTTSVSVNINTEKGMTKRQRNKDFEELCTILENCMPSLYDYEELYGISYNEIKNTYSDKVKDCKNDYEYYYIIQGFLNCIPNCHTYLNDDFTDPLITLLCKYNNQGDALNYWANTAQRANPEYPQDKTDRITFSYVNGSYIVSYNEFDSNLNNAVITKINDKSIEEYIVKQSSIYKLHYDFINKKPYRTELYFNSVEGTECNLTLQLSSGETINKKFYGEADWMHFIDATNTDSQTDDKTNDNENEICEENFYLYNDTDNNLAYLQIYDFKNSNGKILEDALKKINNTDHIIIDLRRNSGGYTQYASEFIYPILFSEDASFTTTRYSMKNSINDKYISTDSMTQMPDDSSIVYDTVISDYIGTALENKKVYILIGQTTASAADNFASVIKYNHLGTLIGNNSGGENVGNPKTIFLKNSGLPISISTYKFNNTDGTNSNVYGTIPDIYCDISMEDHYTMYSYFESNENPYIYLNRIHWDKPVMIAIDLIKEKESKE